ncbi:MAG: recombinase XerD [Blastopirellula sp.]|nr:MAG: recombinase XerD [Blastopirellula sp.]
MAGLEKRNGRYNIIIRFGGMRFVRSLGTTVKKEAEELKERVERRVRLVKTGDIELPVEADVATFLLSDGKLTSKPVASSTLLLSQLFDDFFTNLPEGNLEETTLYGMQLHRRHLERVIGFKFPVQQLTTADLQTYVTKRSKEKGIRDRTVGANTISKELVTFRTVWGWATDHDKVQGAFPKKGVRLPKSREVLPFQTWEEIERQVQNGISGEEQANLWNCLYLSMPQIEEFLADAKQTAAFPFIHPMVCFAAYTGARRSEIMRSHIGDIDFESKNITIREKKRIRGKLSTRRVPLSAPLARVLRQWFKIHPGGPHTFCQSMKIERPKTKRTEPTPITRDEAAHHFKKTMSNSKWEVIRGWHCLRHSFISNCACKGIDQRMIDEWVGHTTESMRRRYRHLFPSSQQEAMELLFQ